MPGDCKAENDKSHPEGSKKVLQDEELVDTHGSAAQRHTETHISRLETHLLEEA